MANTNRTETLTDYDINTLEKLSLCMYDIWSEAIEEKKRDNVYDNKTLDLFMSVFAVTIDDLIHKKNIRDYVSYVRGAHITVESPVIYD